MTNKADQELASLYVRLYFDEDVPAGISKNLRNRGFDVLSAREVEMLGRSDEEQLVFAAREMRSVVTHNCADFEILHQEWLENRREHAGLVLAKRRPNDEVVIRKLLDLLDSVSSDEMKNQRRYI